VPGNQDEPSREDQRDFCRSEGRAAGCGGAGRRRAGRGAIDHYPQGPAANVEFYRLHDHLTGLADRVSADAALETAVRRHRQGGQESAVLLIDLDGFKAISAPAARRCAP
jgi:GGDEF domain-containing protein